MRKIDADELEKALGELRCGNDNAQFILTRAGMAIYEAAIDMAISTLHDAETIDAEPVRHGQWIHVEDDEYLCFSCKMDFTIEDFESFVTNYCPNCGAKMDAKEEESCG